MSEIDVNPWLEQTKKRFDKLIKRENKMSEIKLKPCPFCGGEVRLMTYDESMESDGSPACINYEDELECGTSFVHCYDCDTDFFPHFETAKDVLEHWNTRKPVDAVLDRLEELKNTPPELQYRDLTLQTAIEIVKEGLA